LPRKTPEWALFEQTLQVFMSVLLFNQLTRKIRAFSANKGKNLLFYVGQPVVTYK
jgi:hypothetical protein